jgi:hypothetical protein
VAVPFRSLRRAPVVVGLAGLTSLAFVPMACSGGDQAGGPVVAGPSQVSEAVPASSISTSSVAITVPDTVLLTTAASTSAPTTAAASSGPPSGATGYRPVTPPPFPDHSSLPPTGNSLPDGSYYAVVTGPSPAATSAPSVTASIYEVLTGAPAISAAAADGAGLDSDVYVRPQPVVVRNIGLTPKLVISVAQPDKPDTSYAVSAAELLRLLSGAAPGPGAPATYHYIPFPYLITVAGGAPTRLEQLWSQ